MEQDYRYWRRATAVREGRALELEKRGKNNARGDEIAKKPEPQQTLRMSEETMWWGGLDEEQESEGRKEV